MLMKKSYGLLVVIGGMLIILPLLQARGNIPSPNLHSSQNRHGRLAERASHGSGLMSFQYNGYSLDRTQDYISQPLPSFRLMESTPDGGLVTYRAFDGTVYLLQQYTGKYTAIL